MVGVPRLLWWVAGPSSRIGWPLPWRMRSQPMNFGPISRPMTKAAAGAAPAREGVARKAVGGAGGAGPADEPRADQQADDQGGRGRRARAEGDVAKDVEEAGEAELFCDPQNHRASPPASASTRAASPTELDPVTSIASPGPIASLTRSAAAAASADWALFTSGPSA